MDSLKPPPPLKQEGKMLLGTLTTNFNWHTANLALTEIDWNVWQNFSWVFLLNKHVVCMYVWESAYILHSGPCLAANKKQWGWEWIKNKQGCKYVSEFCQCHKLLKLYFEQTLIYLPPLIKLPFSFLCMYLPSSRYEWKPKCTVVYKQWCRLN